MYACTQNGLHSRRNAKLGEPTILQQAVSKPALYSLISQGCSLQECARMGRALGGSPLQTVSVKDLISARHVPFHHNTNTVP